MTKRRVAVLMGGVSAERDVSLSTGRQILFRRTSTIACTTVVLPSGYRPTPRFPSPRVVSRPKQARCRRHRAARAGRRGRDGSGNAGVLGIPYTGSGVLASALAMDKAMCKRVLMSAGVRMPQDVVVRRGDGAARAALPTLPVIVKPNRQGSTIGMSVVRDPSEMEAALADAFRHDDTALIESFVVGTEITVPVLGNEALEVLPIVEIVPSGGFYDYQAKYTPGATDEIVPARIPDAVAAEARRIAHLCHQTLGCRGMSRTDMIVTPQEDIYTLEVNTIPGMTPTSLLPRSAQAADIPFPRLLDRLIDLALEPNHA